MINDVPRDYGTVESKTTTSTTTGSAVSRMTISTISSLTTSIVMGVEIGVISPINVIVISCAPSSAPKNPVFTNEGNPLNRVTVSSAMTVPGGSI